MTKPTPQDSSPLGAFLRRATVYDETRGAVPYELLRFGLYASMFVIVTGILALVLPGSGSIDGGSFFLVLDGQTADMRSALRALAVPAIIYGLLLLAVDVYLMRGRWSKQWRTAITGQAVVAGISGVVAALFLALVLINVLLWVAIVGCALAIGLRAGN